MSHDTIPAAVRAAAAFGSRDAVVDGSRRIPYDELVAGIRRASAAYLAHGVSPGDRVALWAPNGVEWMLAALGAQYVGAVLVPVNTRYRGHEAADVVARTRARLLVVGQGFLGGDQVGMLRAAAAETAAAEGRETGAGPVPGLPELETVVILQPQEDAEPPAGTVPWERFVADGAHVDPARVEKLADAVTPDDVADILFTSGTTGRSKGAVSAHRQTLGAARVWADLAAVTADDRYLVASPFFHSFGSKAGYLVSLLTGATTLPVAVFDTGTVLDLVERERVTLLPGAPTVYQSMLDDPSLPDRDLGSLRLAVTGAATVPQVLVERMRSDLGFADVLTAYGLTEAVVVTMCVPGDDPHTVATTSGRAVSGVEVVTLTADGRHGGPGETGEVLVRGPVVMQGYLDDPEATAAAVDADGWLHTGDVGVVDERGYLRITDRIKDMFTVGGFNVYPAEIEHVLAAHPDVREAAVIGVPDERLGEVGRAYVVPRTGATPDPDALVAYCRERLANFKVPRSVVLTAELPRNAGGKVVKPELRAAHLAGTVQTPGR
jgi:acyl-CoA synthetase (AMP-forming)/AMP-acid ligase II